VAEALDEALMPDNRYFPKDQAFKASKEGSADARLFRDVWLEAKTRGLGSAPP
jgi:hypothetical protein